VLIHEGGIPTGDYNECPGISGPIVDIVHKLDKAVDIVVSGHTHRAYNCRINGKLVTSGDKYGTLVTEIDVKLDPRTRDIVSAVANNHLVRTDRYAKEPAQTELIAAYDRLARPLADRVVGSITETLSRTENAAGESVLGQVVTDAQLAATAAPDKGAAVIAVTNTGGIRMDITRRADGVVTYGDLFSAQPFGNFLVTVTMTGAQIKSMLEQQWLDQPRPRVLQVSKGFTYTWDDRRPKGDFVPPEEIQLNGTPIQPDKSYRVTVNAFLAEGGDNFFAIKQAYDPLVGPTELAATESYFKANSPISPGTTHRITRAN
jgi:5'-nucleotidase